MFEYSSLQQERTKRLSRETNSATDRRRRAQHESGRSAAQGRRRLRCCSCAFLQQQPSTAAVDSDDAEQENLERAVSAEIRRQIAECGTGIHGNDVLAYRRRNPCRLQRPVVDRQTRSNVASTVAVDETTGLRIQQLLSAIVLAAAGLAADAAAGVERRDHRR